MHQRPAEEPFKISPSMKIGHVSLNVSNLERSLDFYHRILGFKVASIHSGEKALLSAAGESSPYLVELLQVRANHNSKHTVEPKNAGLYHFAILLQERRYLANMLQNLRDNRDEVHFDGLADHLVSESIYIRDPDFNGIEIYRDRQASEWNWNGEQVEMTTLPLNTIDLLKESTSGGWKEMPPKTTIGHVHLHVSNIGKAMKFYREILGFNLTATLPSAAFFAADRYHHHIAANTWLGSDISVASPESVGLNHFSIELQSKEDYARLVRQLSMHNIDLDSSEASILVHDMDGIRVRVQQK